MVPAPCCRRCTSRFATHHERAGGDSASLHPVMMEEVLYGCDVMPSAIHITGSTLSGMRPNVGFNQSRLYTMPYGKQKDSTVKIGSLELLQASTALTLFNTSDPALRTGSVGEETAAQINVDIPDANFDLVIMNPPFTRATNHEGAHADITNPAFATFDATPADQTKMGDRINQLGKDSCYHGNAGIASAFAALAHKKLKAGGVLALVLPLSAAAGLSWQGFRETLAKNYTDLTVLSIAASDNDHLSFSADTGMAECLVIARKLKQSEVTTGTGRGHFVSLDRRAQGFAHAGSLAMNVSNPERARRVEDGPYGGTALMIGDELAGESMTVPVQTDGASWGAVRLSDLSLAQTAYALAQSKLWLPGSQSALDVTVVPLNKTARLGLVDRDITGPRPRGPFEKIAPTPTATYPSLWNHDAKNETRMVCQPRLPATGQVGNGGKGRRCLGYGQPRSCQSRFQVQLAAVDGSVHRAGRAWVASLGRTCGFQSGQFDYAFTLWCNSTLGLLLFWWHSNRQQSGRGRTTIRNVESLPVLDLRALSDKQRRTSETIFNELRDIELKPAYLADADPNRALLDRRVVRDLLGFDEKTYAAVRRAGCQMVR